MQLFTKSGLKYCLMMLMLVMVAQAQKSVDQIVGDMVVAASKGDKAAIKAIIAELKTLGDKGDVKAQYVLADNYKSGHAVPRDLARAVLWYHKSAEQGYAGAQSDLGSMYENGDGIPKNLAQAAFWYRKGAEQGDSYGQSNLGSLYSRGEGVPKDLVIAYMWHNLAAAKGYEYDKKERESLEKRMTPAQIAEAQKLSREWKPKKP